MKIKRLIILPLTALCAMVPTAFAQSSSASTEGSALSPSEHRDAALKIAKTLDDGVAFYEERFYILKNGKPTRVSKPTEVAEGGFVVTRDTLTKDGKKIVLKEGQMITMDGKIINVPKKLPTEAGGNSKE